MPERWNPGEYQRKVQAGNEKVEFGRVQEKDGSGRVLEKVEPGRVQEK